MNRRVLQLFALVALLATALGAGGCGGGADVDDLIVGRWVAEGRVGDRGKPSLDITSDGKFILDGKCSYLDGEWEADRSSWRILSIEEPPSDCSSTHWTHQLKVGEFDVTFEGNNAVFAQDGEQLGAMLRYSAEGNSSSQLFPGDLEGEWRGNRSGVENEIFTLEDDGEATGHDGCNYWSGEWWADPVPASDGSRELHWQGWESTAMLCEPEPRDPDGSKAIWTGDRLIRVDETGTEIYEYSKL